MRHSLEEITKDAEKCASKCWWEAHDKHNRSGYAEAGELFAAQEEIIAKYAGNKPKKAIVANCFALALQTYDNFTEILRTGRGSIEDLEWQLREMLFDVYKTLGLTPEVARHNSGWWIAFARMRLAQKSFAREQTTTEKKLTNRQYDACRNVMIASLVDEHKAKYGLGDKDAKRITDLLLKTEESHNTKDYIRARQLLKPYYRELFLALAEK